MSLVVYVAGSSRELDVCDDYRQRLIAAGFRCSSDWIDAVRKEAAAGRPDVALTHDERVHYARMDLANIDKSDLVWVLAGEQRSVGMWIELGYALGQRNYSTARLQLIVSGHWQPCIFTALADRCFDTHDEAFVWLTKESR